jgi:hypothetical protein
MGIAFRFLPEQNYLAADTSAALSASHSREQLLRPPFQCRYFQNCFAVDSYLFAHDNSLISSMQFGAGSEAVRSEMCTKIIVKIAMVVDSAHLYPGPNGNSPGFPKISDCQHVRHAINY